MLTRRRLRLGAIACACTLLLTVCLAGCTTEPADEPAVLVPTPTYYPAPASPSVDAAAPISAYLAYLAAWDGVVLTESSTIDRVLAFTTGTQRDFDSKLLYGMADRGWTMTGESKVPWIRAAAEQPTDDNRLVVLEVCSSSADVQVLDETGQRRVPPDYAERQVIRATMILAPDAGTNDGHEWLVAETTRLDDDPSCSGDVQ